jgi:hypothetical protein
MKTALITQGFNLCFLKLYTVLKVSLLRPACCIGHMHLRILCCTQHVQDLHVHAAGQSKELLDADRAAVNAIREQQLRAAVKEHKKRQGCRAQAQRLGKARGMCFKGLDVRGISCGGAAECGADVFMQAAPDENGCIDVSRIQKALHSSGWFQGLNVNKVCSKVELCGCNCRQLENGGILMLCVLHVSEIVVYTGYEACSAKAESSDPDIFS